MITGKKNFFKCLKWCRVLYVRLVPDFSFATQFYGSFSDDAYTCTLPKDSGSCDNKIFRYYYNAIEVSVTSLVLKIILPVQKLFRKKRVVSIREDQKVQLTG